MKPTPYCKLHNKHIIIHCQIWHFLQPSTKQKQSNVSPLVLLLYTKLWFSLFLAHKHISYPVSQLLNSLHHHNWPHFPSSLFALDAGILLSIHFFLDGLSYLSEICSKHLICFEILTTLVQWEDSLRKGKQCYKAWQPRFHPWGLRYRGRELTLVCAHTIHKTAKLNSITF